VDRKGKEKKKKRREEKKRKRKTVVFSLSLRKTETEISLLVQHDYFLSSPLDKNSDICRNFVSKNVKIKTKAIFTFFYVWRCLRKGSGLSRGGGKGRNFRGCHRDGHAPLLPVALLTAG
jgi:ribosomal protein S18